MRSLFGAKAAWTLAALILCMPGGVVHAQETGDLNRDGEADVVDVVLALQAIVNPQSTLKHQLLRVYGDLNADGDLNVSDVVLLLHVAIDLPQDLTRPRPPLSGKLAYQIDPGATYPNGALMLYDFATNQLTEISKGWGLTFPQNPHFFRDGSKLAFSAILNGSPHRDIFVWSIGSSGEPGDLTGGNEATEEDPKFSSVDDSIVYKQWDGPKEHARIGVINPNGMMLVPLPIPSAYEELSMPFYLSDGKTLLFTDGRGMLEKSKSDIYKVDTQNCSNESCPKIPLEILPKIPEYYPIPWTLNRFLFVRGLKDDLFPQSDQIHMSDLHTPRPFRLPFNVENAENADPYPVDDRLVIFSSIRAGSHGYDLYLGDAVTGQVWPLTMYHPGLQSAGAELGPAYSPSP